MRSRSQIEAEIDALQEELSKTPQSSITFNTKARRFRLARRHDGGVTLDVNRTDGQSEFVYSDLPADAACLLRDYLLALYPKTEETI